MQKMSTEQVAEVVGLNSATLSRYIKAGKITAPKETMVGRMRVRLWSESDIERLKEALPKIANGRKTRYKKLRESQDQKPQPGAAVPHKQRKLKQKPKAKS
jgi:predicted DNA-binding transcriptional regulator AlpA